MSTNTVLLVFITFLKTEGVYDEFVSLLSTAHENWCHEDFWYHKETNVVDYIHWFLKSERTAHNLVVYAFPFGNSFINWGGISRRWRDIVNRRFTDV